MKAKIVKIKPFTSHHGGLCYLVCFKGDNGKAYRTYVSPKNRNYKNWNKIIRKEGIILKGLRILRNNLIDADSPVEIVKK